MRLKNRQLDMIFRIFTFLVSFLFTSTVFAQNLSDKLLAYYKFNGDAKDNSGNGHDMIVDGAVLALDKDGNANKAYSFNGASAKMTTSKDINIGGNLLSISVWLKAKELSSNTPYGVNIPFLTGGNIALWTQDAVAVGMSLTSYETKSTGGDIKPKNDWIHFVGVYDGRTIKSYVNNYPAGAADLFKVVFESYPFVLGGFSNTFWSGSIDNLYFFNRELDRADIDMLYNTPELTSGLGNEKEFNNALKVFPNPSNGRVSIEMDINKTGRMLVINYLGETVFTKENVSQYENIDLDLPSGCYTLQVNSGNTIAQRKLLIY